MRMIIIINGTTYETTDVPEAIGPWLGRVIDAVRPGPHSEIRVTVL